MRAAVIALGCPKNRVDSEFLLGALSSSGYELTPSPKKADLLFLTTCAFIKPALKESTGQIRRLIALKRKRPKIKLVVAGCLVQRYGRKLKDRFPAVDQWLDLNELHRLSRLSGKTPVRLISTPKHYAYLKIADGCNNHCSYCLIPKIRGPYRSRSMPEIIAEAEALVHLGVKELILVAQDTTSYGKDSYARPVLARLLDRLSQLKGIRWIRLMYTHPAHLTEDVIEQFGSNPKLCRYIDLPIQHINDYLLERMNRSYRRQDVERLLERLRQIPKMRIRTTVITGFPGETAERFKELKEFIKQAQFDRLSGYAYCPESGTPARRFRNRVSSEVAKNRLRQIIRIQAHISRAKLRKLIGEEFSVLVDLPGVGRTEWDAPEIDGMVKIRGNAPAPGNFVRVRITNSSTHDLIAALI
ncbi:MAG: 30S ribosomal protein S12 methylthiotransferase RimO [bacterium]